MRKWNLVAPTLSIHILSPPYYKNISFQD